MARVGLVNVSKTYEGGVRAVESLSLDAADGELLVLVGPSGSGKSTALRMIAGLETADAGEITIGGRVANRLHPKDRDIAMVFQDYALYPHMTAAGNMAFSLKMRKVPRDEIRRRVERAADLLSIREILDRKPHALSGGQQQRVALGRAIVREPAVFLFDEPLSNLDARLRLATRGEIKSLQRRLGTTMIYVTHDQEEAMTLGDRLAVMCAGRLQQLGTPLAVYRRPANRFVASFIGAPPMNFLPGRVERGAGAGSGAVFVEEGGGARLALPAELAAAADGKAGGAVVLGLRPQGLAEGTAGRDEPEITIDVELVESLGETMDVAGRTQAGRPVTARLPAREGFPGSGRVTLRVDRARLHLFEPGEFGRRLGD